METLKLIKVSGDQALDELKRLRKAWSSTGLFPFIIGTDEEVAELKEMIQPPSDGGEAVMQQAAEFDIEAWLKERRPQKKSAWPKQSLLPSTGILSLHDVLTGKLKPEINIGLVKATASWQIFAKLGYGDWNDCPAPHIHAALNRYWWNKHKATLLYLSDDIVEYFVQNPVTEKKAALELAYEHYSYCYDIVDQGAGTIGKLASSLLNGRYWYFWWD